uniref:Uncharacterized protein n=1 Tax=Macaca fascicularis TaxID=9541 RepID=A0A7N9CVL9_MACFA
CWKFCLGVLVPQEYIQSLQVCLVQRNCGSRVHVHNVQVCYICILVPCCCAAPINSSAPNNSSFTSG